MVCEYADFNPADVPRLARVPMVKNQAILNFLNRFIEGDCWLRCTGYIDDYDLFSLPCATDECGEFLAGGTCPRNYECFARFVEMHRKP